MKKISQILLVLFIYITIPGCLAGEKNASVLEKTFKGNRLLSEGVNRIYIDKISDGYINSIVIESVDSSLRNKINLNKNLSVVNSPEFSDMILKVWLTSYISEPVKFNSSGIIEERRLKIDSFICLISSTTGEEIIKKKYIDSVQFYSDVIPPVTSEFKAITGLTDMLSERIVSVLITGWYLDKDPQSNMTE